MEYLPVYRIRHKEYGVYAALALDGNVLWVPLKDAKVAHELFSTREEVMAFCRRHGIRSNAVIEQAVEGSFGERAWIAIEWDDAGEDMSMIPPEAAMHVTMLLCDGAQAVNGKLYILGGGWSIITPTPCPWSVALKIAVPSPQVGKVHTLVIGLYDSDEHPVKVPLPYARTVDYEMTTQFEAIRNPDLLPGAPHDVNVAITMAPIHLTPSTHYQVKCRINGIHEETWTARFCTRGH